MSTLWADLRLALRMFRRHRVITAVILVTLSLGIGANTTILSLIHAILLRPFPYAEPERLVRLHTESSAFTGNLREASVFDLQDWRAQNRSFEELATYWSFVNTLSGEAGAQSVLMTFATPQLFDVLRVKPVAGRVFISDEDRIGGPVNQVVLSFGLWQTRFGGRVDVLGQTIKLRGDTFTVISCRTGATRR
jgi:putative ABC transport system permease protein